MYIDIIVPRPDLPRLPHHSAWWLPDGEGGCLDFDHYKIDNINPGLCLIADLYDVLHDEGLRDVIWENIIHHASLNLSHSEFSSFINGWDMDRPGDWTIKYLKFLRDDDDFSLRNVREMTKIMLKHKFESNKK